MRIRSVIDAVSLPRQGSFELFANLGGGDPLSC